MLLNGKKTSAPADSGADGMAVRQSKRRRPRVKRLVAVVLVCALAGGGAWYFLGVDDHTAAAAGASYTTAQVERRTITAPITGTVVDKYYNAGEISEANQVMCTIYDLSYLTMTLSVDELDISDIAVGQAVTVTADAVEDQTYQGVVTKVSVAGTSSGSATTYPVTIRIDETDGLLPGMSVDATIELDSAEDALAIPAAALNRGNTVLVTADSPSAVNAAAQETPEGDAAPGETTSAASGSDGTVYVSIPATTGVSDGNYIQILDGLQEGDVVAYLPTSASGGGDMMMGGMPGGMGGGMPGGMGGGMPGGGPGGM